MIAEQEIDNVLNGLEDAFQILGYHEGMAVLERRIVDKALKEPKIARFLKDMEKYDKPRLQGSPASPHNIERRHDDSLNYFAPKRNLQAMLTQEWFDRMCIDKKRYAREWRETFVSNLMASEHGEYIARKWADHKQILMIRALPNKNLPIQILLIQIFPNIEKMFELKLLQNLLLPRAG